MLQKGSVEEQQASHGSSTTIFCVLTVPAMKHLLQFIIVGPIFLYYFPRARAIYFSDLVSMVAMMVSCNFEAHRAVYFHTWVFNNPGGSFNQKNNQRLW